MNFDIKCSIEEAVNIAEHITVNIPMAAAACSLLQWRFLNFAHFSHLYSLIITHRLMIPIQLNR